MSNRIRGTGTEFMDDIKIIKCSKIITNFGYFIMIYYINNIRFNTYYNKFELSDRIKYEFEKELIKWEE